MFSEGFLDNYSTFILCVGLIPPIVLYALMSLKGVAPGIRLALFLFAMIPSFFTGIFIGDLSFKQDRYIAQVESSIDDIAQQASELDMPLKRVLIEFQDNPDDINLANKVGDSVLSRDLSLSQTLRLKKFMSLCFGEEAPFKGFRYPLLSWEATALVEVAQEDYKGSDAACLTYPL